MLWITVVGEIYKQVKQSGLQKEKETQYTHVYGDRICENLGCRAIIFTGALLSRVIKSRNQYSLALRFTTQPIRTCLIIELPIA